MHGYKNFKGTPHPGDLCHWVEIGYTEDMINKNGYPEQKDWCSAAYGRPPSARAINIIGLRT